MIPTAKVGGGGTKASFDGQIPAFGGTASLTIQSRTANHANADANVDAISIGLAGVGVGDSADTEITSGATNEASIGSHAAIVVSSAVTIDAGQTAANFAEATAEGTAFRRNQRQEVHRGGARRRRGSRRGRWRRERRLARRERNRREHHATATTKSFQTSLLGFGRAGTLAEIRSDADVTAKSARARSSRATSRLSALDEHCDREVRRRVGRPCGRVHLQPADRPRRRQDDCGVRRRRPERHLGLDLVDLRELSGERDRRDLLDRP